MFGDVLAAVPQPAGQDGPELLSLDDYRVDEPGRTLMCQARGDSMKDAVRISAIVDTYFRLIADGISA